MIIISSRKFRDSQSEYFRKALTEDVILTTVHYGCFKLVPVIEGEPRKNQEKEIVKLTDEMSSKTQLKSREEIVSSSVFDENYDVAESRYQNSGDNSTEAEKYTYTAVESGMVPNMDSVNEPNNVSMEGDNNNVKAISDSVVPTSSNDSQSQSMFVDPSLYDSNPEMYAKELEEQRKMIEELRYTGFKKLMHKFTKK